MEEALDLPLDRLLKMMMMKVGPETDPCGQPLVTRLELTELPNVLGQCALFGSPSRYCKYLEDILVSRVGREFQGAKRCRKRLLCSVLGGSTFVQVFCFGEQILRQPLWHPMWTCLL